MDPHAVLRLVRPRQWTKNLAVFAALVFAREMGDVGQVARSVVAFVALCFVSAGLYAFNDVLDAKRDRAHPLKRSRPVASGALSARQASIIGALCIGTGALIAVFLGWRFAAGIALFASVQVAYFIGLKHIAIVEMITISAGFMVRAVAGAWAIGVPVSPWLVLSTGLLALFLATAKRRHELLLLDREAHAHRPVLARYTAEVLDSFMVTLSAATITVYALYTFFEPHGPGYTMMLTIPFVVYGVLRYQLLAVSADAGGQPEETLLTDVPICVDVLAWIVTSVVILYLLPA